MIPSFSEPTNLLMLGLAVVVGGYLLFKIASKILKTVLFFVIVGLVIYFWQGGTVSDLKDTGVRTVFNKKTTLSGMVAQLCEDEKAEKVKCICIVQPVHEDLTRRLSAGQMAAIDRDSDRVQEEIRISLGNQRKAISNCLVKNKGSQYMEALKEVIGKGKEGSAP